MSPFRRRISLAPSERRIRPSALRRVAFFALGVAAAFARTATWPGRRALRRRVLAAAPDAPEPVFLLEPYGLGDAIALQPLVRALCEAGRDVAVGTRRAWFPVFPPHPRLALVESVPPWAARDERRKYRRLFRRLRAYLPTLRSAARGRVGIDPRGDVRSILALYAAGCVRVETLTHYATANDCLVFPGAAHRHPVRRDVARWRLNGVFAPDLPLSPPDLRFLLPASSITSTTEYTEHTESSPKRITRAVARAEGSAPGNSATTFTKETSEDRLRATKESRCAFAPARRAAAQIQSAARRPPGVPASRGVQFVTRPTASA